MRLYPVIIKAPVAFAQYCLAGLGHLVASRVSLMRQNDILAQLEAFAPFINRKSNAKNDKRENKIGQHFHAPMMRRVTRTFKSGASPC
jgi:hypothetical protein